MTAFLIQTSGHSIQEYAAPAYIAGAQGPRFCDEPLSHGEYFNASPFWKRDGYGRHDVWQRISPGDTGVLYCTGSVDEHGACLSHLLTVEDVSRDDAAGARLVFSEVRELISKIPYGDIQAEIEAGRFSDQMAYAGQEGFNITQIPESDVARVNALAQPMDSQEPSTDAQPDESLRNIVDDYLGDDQ